MAGRISSYNSDEKNAHTSATFGWVMGCRRSPPFYIVFRTRPLEQLALVSLHLLTLRGRLSYYSSASMSSASLAPTRREITFLFNPTQPPPGSSGT